MSLNWRWGEAKAILCGDKLGEGTTRRVYVCRLNEQYVVKVEPRGTAFQNVEEWKAWWWACGHQKRHWLAPCEFISPCGLILIQQRVTPLRRGEHPRTIPAWLADLKKENFGMLDGKVVACDYGTVLSGFREASSKPIKPRWKP